MNDQDVLGTVKESFTDVHLNRPLQTILATGRARRRRTALAGTAVATAAIAVLGIFALTQTDPSPPAAGTKAGPAPGQSQRIVQTATFTLVHNVDGSITFTVNDLVDTTAATQALNDAGIVGRVVNVGADPNCPTESNDIVPTDLYPDDTNSRHFNDGQRTATFSSTLYPAGGGLLLAVLDFEGTVSRLPEPITPTVFGIAFDDAAKIPTCLNASVDPD